MALSKKMMLIIGSLIILLIVVVSVVVVSTQSSAQSSSLIVTRAPTMSPTTMSPTTMSPTTMSPTTMSPTTMSPTTMSPTTMAKTTMAPTTMAPVIVNYIPRFPVAQNGQNYLLQNQVMESPYLGVFNNQSAYLSSPPYRFYLQTDGNLVIYKTDVNPWTPIWASNTQSNFGKLLTDGSVMLRLILNSVGNLVLYYYILSPTSAQASLASVSAQTSFGAVSASASLSDIPTTSGLVPVWSTNTENRGGTRLVIQSDSNLVIYRNSNNTSPVWSTITGML